MNKVKEFTCNAGDTRDLGSIPGSGLSSGAGHDNALNILAWRIPWTGQPDGLQSMMLQRHPGRKRLSPHEHTCSLLSQISWVLSDARKRKKGIKENWINERYCTFPFKIQGPLIP